VPMMTKHETTDAGLDGLSEITLELLTCHANHAHPTCLPPPTPDVDAARLSALRRRLAAAGHVWAQRALHEAGEA
jgi:hypothetical protein